MKIHTLDSSLLVHAPLEETFRFFEKPENLARITPPSMGFRIISEDFRMRKGLEIEYKVGIFGLPVSWKSLISEYDPPHMFVDEAIRSPYALWRHRHTFREAEGCTVVGDHVDYAMPLSPLSEPGHFIVRLQLNQIFGFRRQALARCLRARVTEVRAVQIS